MQSEKKTESIIVIVGFLGAGKTTLLKRLVREYVAIKWNPFVILNDYENAYLDSQQFADILDLKEMWPMNGSCICCSGIHELRDQVNRIPERDKGITFIEANGTSDACSLMGFLGVGLEQRFAPPVQVSVVDVANWQKRGEYNELEANQVQVSSLIVLSHTEAVFPERIAYVKKEILALNPMATFTLLNEIDISLLPKLMPSTNEAEKMDHLKAHWSSCSIDLLHLPTEKSIYDLCAQLPKSIQRVKGCTQIGTNETYTFFARTPDLKVSVRPFNGVPMTGPKLIVVGPGSSTQLLEEVVMNCGGATQVV